MPYKAHTLPPDIACSSFLAAYPYPAFVLNQKVSGKKAASLIPIFTNIAFRNLVFGPNHANKPESIAAGGLLECLPGTGFEGIENARRLGEWIEKSSEGRPHTYLLEVDPQWLPRDHPPIHLELAKTQLKTFWIVTSTPRTPLPDYDVLSRLEGHSIMSKSLRRSISGSLRLGDLPPRLNLTDNHPKKALKERSVASGNMGDDRAPRTGSECPQLLEEVDWEHHVLGPKDKWPESLKTVVSIVMGSPYPWAVWWGPELVLIYNDGYAGISGAKHPSLFGKAGQVAWGELWENLGPLAHKVISQEQAVWREDDQMFFFSLTEKLLPEEVYHSWAWIPIRNGDGSFGGLLNTTTEATSKVLYDRRVSLLRHLGDKTAIARSKADFAEAARKILTDYAQLDMPFVAFYFNHVDARPKPSALDLSARNIKLRVTSILTFTIGIRDDHPAFPGKISQQLDPTTLRPSPALDETALGIPLEKAPENSDDSSTVTAPFGDDGRSEGSEPSEPQWPLFDVFSLKKPLFVSQVPSSVSENVGYRAGGWNDPPREAAVIPIAAEGEEVAAAVMVIGLNTRRPYDKGPPSFWISLTMITYSSLEHRTWIELLHMTLSSTLTATLSREAESKKAEQLAQLDAAKTSFFSSASHELRTPLTLIAAPVGEALRISTEPGVRDLLKLSTRNIARLQRLVDSLMDFSRVEAGRLLGRFKLTNLAAFTTDLASLFRPTIEKQGIEYSVITDNENESLVYVDHELWEKIVFNLVGNAFKYTLSGSVRVTVQFKPPYAQFVVSDTGIGIPEDELEKIFDRFHRVTSSARSVEGTGIGLALTRELVKVHGGHITIQSTVEVKGDPDRPHGTSVTVHIPLGNDHLSAADLEMASGDGPMSRTYGRGIIEEATSWSAGKAASGGDSTPSEGTSVESATSTEKSGDLAAYFRFSRDDVVLIVDDNYDIRKFLRTIFRQYCSVLEAESGPKAFALLETHKADLIISDVMMHDHMDGLQFVKALRERPDIAWTPTILLSARAGDEARVEGLLSGADDYIAKPFKTQELLARAHLHMHIGRRKLELQKLFEERTKEIKILSDLSPVGIFRMDPQGQITYTNRRWHEITDSLPNDTTVDWIRNVHPDCRQEIRELVSRILHQDEKASVEIRWENGKWTKFQAEQISGGLIGTVTDVSDRHLYEAARIAQAQEREALAQLRASDAERQRAEADERRRAQELLVDVTSHELRQPVSAILNCSQLVRSNLSNLAQQLRNVDQRPFVPTQALLSIIDEDLEALDSIYQCKTLYGPAKLLLITFSLFLGGLSQERIANDVLSLSRMQLDTLSIQSVEFNLPQELTRVVSIFANELRMKNILLDILIGSSVAENHVSRVASDRTRFAQVVTNLMSNAVKFTDISPGPERRISVQLEVSPEPPLPNTYTPPPPNADSAYLSSAAALNDSQTHAYVYVAVTDSGPGLKPGDLTRLFQRFQQGMPYCCFLYHSNGHTGSNSENVFGGSGLGLFVSRKLCELMGGSIGVDTIYGQGATFRFYFRVKLVNDNSEEITVPPRRTPPSIESVPYPPRTAYHVLITEDNVLNQTILNRQLKMAGFTTQLASNGREALERIATLAERADDESTLPRRFDVILMDCEMPVMDGLAATREIRRLEAEGKWPHRNLVIALTGNARKGQVDAAVESGMDDVMIKPYQIDELVRKIRSKINSD